MDELVNMFHRHFSALSKSVTQDILLHLLYLFAFYPSTIERDRPASVHFRAQKAIGAALHAEGDSTAGRQQAEGTADCTTYSRAGFIFFLFYFFRYLARSGELIFCLAQKNAAADAKKMEGNKCLQNGKFQVNHIALCCCLDVGNKIYFPGSAADIFQCTCE